MPKYSIILPTYNASNYLRDAIDSVLSQDYMDFEFIISNNCSTDDTEKILAEINDPRVKIIKPDNTLPLGAHWNFALKHATGEWLWALGTDDAMVPYFFEICDKLIEYCEKKNIKILKSNRAYYFWPGYENVYGSNFIYFELSSKVIIKKTKKIMKDMLSGKASYFDIPQMYVTSLFHRSIIDKAELYSKTNDVIPYNVPAQDSYLGILACAIEEKYLYVEIPLGWVGTSPSAMCNKIDKNQLEYDDSELSKIAGKVHSLIFHMHLAFRAFSNNSSIKIKKFSKSLSSKVIFTYAFIHDIEILDDTNSRRIAFFDYLDSLGISKRSIIFRAKFKSLVKQQLIIKWMSIFFVFFKRCERIFFNKKKCSTWSISFDNDFFFPYKEINNIIKNEKHVKKIISELMENIN